MSNEVVVHKGRTNVVTVRLGIDISSDTFDSEIRTHPTRDALLIATWTVDFLTDGTDGQLTLTLLSAVTSGIKAKEGFMDVKRTTSGEPISVFDKPLEVIFRDVVTE